MRTVLITGASRGLGAAIARGFAAQGDHVVLTWRVSEERCAGVVAEIEAAGGSATMIQLDVTHRDGPGEAVSEVLEQRGRLDVLINNAAITREAFFTMDDAAAWEEVVAVDLLGATRCARAAVRPMLQAGSGIIVNVGSIAALRASPGQTAYAAAKGGLLAFTRSLAVELAPRGVRVNAVVPGMLDVGMATRMPRRISERWKEHIPLGRVGRADEIVPAVRFLASDDARYIVGQALVVDGGLAL